MKKLLLLAACAAFALAELIPLRVGTTPAPYGEILREYTQIAKDLETMGYKLVHTDFTDYLTPNFSLDAKELDATLHQHAKYLANFNENKGTKLAVARLWLVNPLSIYSRKIKDIKATPKGATVALPNDPTNESRAIDLLVLAGLIEADMKNELKTVLDITKNPLELKFEELEAAQLPRVLDEVDLDVIPGNYALGAGLEPLKEGLFFEDKDNVYANITVAVRQGEEESEKTKALIKAITTPELAKYIKERYKGALQPRF